MKYSSKIYNFSFILKLNKLNLISSYPPTHLFTYISIYSGFILVSTLIYYIFFFKYYNLTPLKKISYFITFNF